MKRQIKMMTLMMVTMMKMVRMPMVNSAEDNPGHHIIIIDCPQVSFCQNPGDHSNFTIFLRPAFALSCLLFMLFSSLKRNGALAMMMMMKMKMKTKLMIVTFQIYGHYNTLLCCLPKNYKLLWSIWCIKEEMKETLG